MAGTDSIAAIPTFYGGSLHRSQLEAHWAAFTDLLGWRNRVYEPQELKSTKRAGHIPDFALVFPHGTIMLSIKPIYHIEGLEEFAKNELDYVQWDGDWIAGGAVVPIGLDSDVVGILSETNGGPEGKAKSWDSATISICLNPSVDPHIGIQHTVGSFACRVCGWHPGGQDRMGKIPVELSVLWAHAGNAIRWQDRKNAVHQPFKDRLAGPLWGRDGMPRWDASI